MFWQKQFGELVYDPLLDSHQHLTPFIYGDFNVHEHSWLSSTNSSGAGTATKDFSDSRGLLQLVDFPIHGTAILDLVLYGHQGSILSFPTFMLLIIWCY